MAILESETFDGLTDGETISTGNTSFDTVSGTSLQATTNAIHGDAAMDINGASSTNQARWTSSVDGRTLLYARVYVRVVGLPGNDAWFFGCGNTDESVAVVVMLEPDGNIAIVQSNETGNKQSSSAVFGADDELRIEWELDLDNDTQTAELFVGANVEGTTADETLTTSASMADMGDWRIGRILSRTTPVVVDQLAIGDAPIGPVTSGQEIAVGQALSTEQALSTIASKSRVIGQAQSTELALSTVPSKAGIVGQALSTELALSTIPSKAREIGQAQSTELALSVVASKSREIGQAQSTELALSIGASEVAVPVNRTVTVQRELRTLTVQSEDRTAVVQRESRTLEIT